MKAEAIFKKYKAESAYRIASLDNKKLYFKTFSGLIIDLYSINNQNIEENVYNNYIQNLIKLGEVMDKIPSDYESMLKLSDKVYIDYILKSSGVQKSMLNLLVNELKILKQKNK